MSLRYVLAAALLIGSTVGASAQLTIPSDSTQAQQQKKKDSTDGLFNHRVSDHWDNGGHSDNDLGGVHFTARSSSDYGQSSTYGDASKPMSEFYGPKPQQSDNTDPPTSDH